MLTYEYLKENFSDLSIVDRVNLCRVLLAPIYAQEQISWCEQNVKNQQWHWGVDECENMEVGQVMLFFRFWSEEDAIQFKLRFC